jgi:hypothetical protein
VKGKVLGRHLLAKVATIVTPDTILRFHHLLIAAKWTHKTNRVGRPGIMKADSCAPAHDHAQATITETMHREGGATRCEW